VLDDHFLKKGNIFAEAEAQAIEDGGSLATRQGHEKEKDFKARMAVLLKTSPLSGSPHSLC
jgi:hypothetical protein